MDLLSRVRQWFTNHRVLATIGGMAALGGAAFVGARRLLADADKLNAELQGLLAREVSHQSRCVGERLFCVRVGLEVVGVASRMRWCSGERSACEELAARSVVLALVPRRLERLLAISDSDVEQGMRTLLPSLRQHLVSATDLQTLLVRLRSERDDPIPLWEDAKLTGP